MENPKQFYDLEVLRKQLNNDESFVQHMIKSYVEKTPSQVDELENAAKTGDGILLGKLAHKLKSPAKMMGMKQVAETLFEIEQQTKENKDAQTLLSKTEAVSNIIRSVIDDLKQF